MAVSSTITLDSLAGTAICNILLNNVTVLDTITYTNSSKQISFPTRNPVTLSATDFILNLNIFITFNNLIVSPIFNASNPAISSYSTNLAQSDDNVSQLNWTFQVGNHPLFDFACTYPNGNVVLGNRNQSAVLNQGQWVYFLYLINNYIQTVKRVYKI